MAPQTHNPMLRSGAAPTGWDLGITIFLAGVLLAVILSSQTPARQTVGWALAYVLFAIGPSLVLSLLEQLTRAAGPRKSAKKWWLHLQILLAYNATAVPFGFLGVYVANLLVKSVGLDLGLVDLRISNGKEILVIIAALFLNGLIGDFFFYWLHRGLHKSAILWQHHKLHHMDPEFDALTLFRTNWFEGFYSVFLGSIPMVVLFKFNDLDPFNTGLAQGAIIGLMALFRYQNHSNMRLQFGKATVFFTSSQSHRIHHSCLPQHQDKNFVAIFPIWDILFGTYYHPARDEFPPTGVVGENDIQSVWEAQIFPLREWRKMFRTWRQGRVGRGRLNLPG